MIWSMANLGNGKQFHLDQCQKKQELVSSGDWRVLISQESVTLIILQMFLSNAHNIYLLKIDLNSFEISNTVLNFQNLIQI